ncbi:hypothetical protein LSAT2_004189 [Lamellibrachia satsuma]|nr:hypothetical protein LSAT2_004189 [Lamellibrachia satsuma]
MKASYRPATQLPFAGSTSSEDTDDDGDIKTARLKRSSLKANITIRLKRASHFRGRSDGRRFHKFLDNVVSQTVCNASIFFIRRRNEKTKTKTEQDKATDWDPESDNEISFCLPSSSRHSSSSSDSTSSEDADDIEVYDGDIEAGRPKRTSVKVTVARRLKPEASSGFNGRSRSLATAVGITN